MNTKVYARDYFTARPLCITIAGPVITSVQELTAEQAATHEQAGLLPLVGPGFLDIQINGCHGVDFNNPALTQAELEQAASGLLKDGVTGFLPTLITNTPDNLLQTAAAINQAVSNSTLLQKMILGIHLEGPFISPEDGARGAHPKDCVRPPDWDLFARIQHASGQRIVVTTLSPEWDEAPAFIKQCRSHGVIPAIGHTAASPAQIRTAVAAGAQLATHLGNGSHQMLPRHDNYVWEQLAADELWAGLICDGFHLPLSVLKVFLRTKQDKAVIVSDAVHLAGMAPGEYATHIGRSVTLTPHGKLHLTGTPGILAGSAQTLLWGISHLIQAGLVTPEQAWSMASVRPGRLLGLRWPTPENGAPADFVLAQKLDTGLAIQAVYLDGKPVFTAAA